PRATATGGSRGPNPKPAVDRASAEAAQPQAVIGQAGAHSRRQAGAHLQTLRRRYRAPATAGPPRPPRPPAPPPHGPLPPRLVIARLLQPAAHAAVDQQRFVRVAPHVGGLYRLLLLRVGLLAFRSSAYLGTLKARLRLARCASARCASARTPAS